MEMFLVTEETPMRYEELWGEYLLIKVNGGVYFTAEVVGKQLRIFCPTPTGMVTEPLEAVGLQVKEWGILDSKGPDAGLNTPIFRASVKSFTSQQQSVLSLILEGCPNKIIAFKMGLKESTVKVHIRNLFKKVKVTNRTQLVSKFRNGSSGLQIA